MNVALVGFMGTGKTAAARIAANRLGWEYLDIDDMIERKEAMKITDIFKLKGEAYFRKAEKNTVAEVSLLKHKVIACGGGVVIDEENIRNLKNSGLVICLQARPEVIFERVKLCKDRPLLNVPDPKAKIAELLEARRCFYEKADYSLDTSDLKEEEVAEQVVSLVNKYKGEVS